MSPLLFHYLLIHWLIALIPISLGIFVVLRDTKNALYWAFLRYNFVISWWGIFTLFMEYAATSEQALFWDRISLLGIVFIPAAFLHFTWMYSGKSKYYDFILRICYSLSAVFFLLVFTPLMAKSATQKYIIPYFTDPGHAYHFFVSYFTAVMTFGNVLVFKAWRNCNDNRRRPGVLLFLIATALSTVGGGGNFLVPYEVYTPYLFPYGGYSFILYGFLIAFTILRYRFLDVDVIIKKTLIFAGLTAFVLAIFSGVSFVMQQLLQRFVGAGETSSFVVSVLIIVVAYDRVRVWLIAHPNPVCC